METTQCRKYLAQIHVHRKHRPTLQSLTGKYRGLQENPCNENRDPVMRTGVPCNENRFFPVRIDLQGVPCKPYRFWVCSAVKSYVFVFEPHFHYNLGSGNLLH